MHNSAKKIIKQYHDNQEVYRSLKHDIEDIFTRIIETHHFRISNMAIRIKSEDALMKKITYKNKYQDISQITDGDRGSRCPHRAAAAFCRNKAGRGRYPPVPSVRVT